MLMDDQLNSDIMYKACICWNNDHAIQPLPPPQPLLPIPNKHQERNENHSTTIEKNILAVMVRRALSSLANDMALLCITMWISLTLSQDIPRLLQKTVCENYVIRIKAWLVCDKQLTNQSIITPDLMTIQHILEFLIYYQLIITKYRYL